MEKFVVVQLFSRIWLFVTPWMAAHKASPSFTVSWNLFKLMSIESKIPSNHLICHPFLLLPSIFRSIRVFPNKSAFTSGGQNIGASASTSVLSMNTQGWFPLELIGLIPLLCKELSRKFSSTTVWRHQLFSFHYGAQLSLWSNSHNRTWLLEKP